MLAKLGADILGGKVTSKQDREYSLLYSDNIEQPNDKDEDEKNRSGEFVEDDRVLVKLLREEQVLGKLLREKQVLRKLL